MGELLSFTLPWWEIFLLSFPLPWWERMKVRGKALPSSPRAITWHDSLSSKNQKR